jgi:hypothetical protein
MRPNPPTLVTVALAVVLLVVGLSLTIIPIGFINEALVTLPQAIGIEFALTPQVGWICLLAANLLLIAGSLFRGI